jgi:hypothetical protein
MDSGLDLPSGPRLPVLTFSAVLSIDTWLYSMKKEGGCVPCTNQLWEYMMFAFIPIYLYKRETKLTALLRDTRHQPANVFPSSSNSL